LYSVSTGNFCPTLLQLIVHNRKTSATLPSNTASISRIMFIRYLNLAIIAFTALSQSAAESANSIDMARQLTGDFDWDIQPEDGFPVIVLGDAN
jgi:hypothetical protein